MNNNLPRYEYLIKHASNIGGKKDIESLNNLGDSGWELIAATYNDTTKTTTLIFKRAKRE